MVRTADLSFWSKNLIFQLRDLKGSLKWFQLFGADLFIQK